MAIAVALAGCEGAAPDRVEAPAAPADTAPASATETGAVDFRLIGPNDVALVVPVRINGHGPYDFVLDTGATLTCLGEELAVELGLPETRAVAYGTGVGGSGRMRLVRADTVRVGDAAAFDLTVCALDLSRLRSLPGMEMDGLLGLNFLRHFRVTLDFADGTLQLHATD